MLIIINIIIIRIRMSFILFLPCSICLLIIVMQRNVTNLLNCIEKHPAYKKMYMYVKHWAVKNSNKFSFNYIFMLIIVMQRNVILITVI